jgi:hypothetical protein
MSTTRHRIDTRPPKGYLGEPDNPYSPWSGCWRAFNAAAIRRRAFEGIGFLYATQRESDSNIKIGMSSRPIERFISYRCSYLARHDRYSLLWIVEVPEMQKCERLVHLGLRSKLIDGEREWFFISKRDAFMALAVVGNPIYIGCPFQTPRKMPRYEFP